MNSDKFCLLFHTVSHSTTPLLLRLLSAAESVWWNCSSTHLIKEQLSSLLFPEVHLLHSHLLAAVFLAGDAHDTRGAFADFDKAVQVFPRVACRQESSILTKHQKPKQPRLYVQHQRSFFLF